MSLSTRTWLYVLGTAFALLLGSSPARAQTNLTFWHAYTGAEEQGLARAIEAFRSDHPDLNVEVLTLPFGAYSSKLEAAIPAGRGPDLFIDAHERLPVYLERHLIDPFTASEDEQAFEPRQLAVLRDRGALYGIPLSVKCAALYVNTKLVPDPNALTSFDAIAALRDRLPKNVYPLAFQADDPYYLAGFLHANGAKLIDDQGAYGFFGPGAVRTLTLLRDWSRRGVLPEEPSADLTKRLFTGGHAATMVGGPWLAPDLPRSLSWQVIPLPPLHEGQAPLEPFVTVEAAYLAHHPAVSPERVRFARELAMFLARGKGALIRAEVGRQVVAARTLSVPSATLADPLIEVFRNAAARGLPMSIHPHMRRVWEPAQRAAKKGLRGEGGVENALAEGKRRFEDAVRPMPEPASPTPLLLGIGVILLLGSVQLVRQASDPVFRSRVKKSLPAYAYVTHALIAVLLLVIGPLTIGAVTSFFAGKGRDLYYVGLANYVDILTARGGDLLASGSFWFVLLVTLLWTVCNLVAHVLLGVTLALLLVRVTGHTSKIYRVLLILPWAVPSYVTALAWKGMFHRQFGAINALLDSFGVAQVNWFAQFSTAFAANLSTNAWLGFPFMMVVTLGALTSIPRELYEAASVDGATASQQLRFITLPMIRPVLAPAVAMGAVWTFNMFNVIFLVSGGEPDGTTEVLVSEAYRWAFTRSSQYGYAAAYAVLIFGILVIGTRLMNPWLEEKKV